MVNKTGSSAYAKDKSKNANRPTYGDTNEQDPDRSRIDFAAGN
jgi:hypothetical protein